MRDLIDLIEASHLESLPGHAKRQSLPAFQQLPTELLRLMLLASLPALPPILDNIDAYVSVVAQRQQRLADLRCVHSAFNSALGTPILQVASTSFANAAHLSEFISAEPAEKRGSRIRSIVLRVGNKTHPQAASVIRTLFGHLPSLLAALTIANISYLVLELLEQDTLRSVRSLTLHLDRLEPETPASYDRLEALAGKLAQSAPSIHSITLHGGPPGTTAFSVAKFSSMVTLTVHEGNYTSALLALPNLRQLNVIIIKKPPALHERVAQGRIPGAPPRPAAPNTWNWRRRAEEVFQVERERPIELRVVVKDVTFETDRAGAAFAFLMLGRVGAAPFVSVHLCHDASGHRVRLWPAAEGLTTPLIPTPASNVHSDWYPRSNWEDETSLALVRCSWI
ncbi:hypothetical protein RQP46_000921 [Phenoliferia psychrophenolica]